MSNFRGALPCILATALLCACSIPMITPEMVSSAKDDTGLVATSSNKRVTLTWVEDPTAVEYVLRYTKNGSEPSPGNGITLSGVRPPLSLAGLANGDLHVFDLKATYRSGAVTDVGTVRSIPLSMTTLAPQVTGEIGAIRVRWPAIRGTNEFEVQRRVGNSGDFAKLAIVGTCEFVDSNVVESQVYYYRIKPSSGSEVSSAANPARPAFSAYAPRIDSAIATQGNALDIARNDAPVDPLNDNHVYLSNGTQGLKVLALDADGKPTFVRDVAFPAGLTGAEARSMSASGTWLCVAAEAGLAWYDITDPSNPASPRSVVMAKPFSGVTNRAFATKIKGNFAYVACLGSGLQVVNLVSGGIVQTLAGVDVSVSDVELCNGYIIATVDAPVAMGGNTLNLYSVNSSTGALTDYRSVPIPAIGAGKYIAVSDKTVFVGVRQTLYVVSIETPSTPTIIKTMDFKPALSGLNVVGNRCLVFSEFNNLVYDYDISDPAKPFLSLTCEMPTRPAAAIASGSSILIASNSAGLHVLFDPRQYLRQSGWIKTADYGTFYGRDVKIRGDLCFLVGSGNLSIVDISSPAAPRALSRLDLPAEAMSIALSGNYAYVTSSSGTLHVVDVSDPAAPQIASTATVPGSPAGVAVFGDRAFITNASARLQVVDVSDPDAASSTGETVKLLDQSDSDITIDGAMAYLAAGTYYGQLQCVDLSNPTSTATSVPLVSRAPAIQGAYAYARDYIDGSLGLHVTNVSDPLKPTKFGFAPCPYFGDPSANIQGNIVASGGFAYAVVWGIGVQRFSIANPAAPSYVATFSGSSSYDVDVSGSLCVIATSKWPVGEGIEIWSLEP